MKTLLVFGSMTLLLSAGCSRSGPDARAPSGEVYEGKHVSEWGDQLKSSEEASRLQAAKLLVKMGTEGRSTKEALLALEGALGDESAAVRGWSVVGLAYSAKGTPFPFGQKPVIVAAMKEAAESSDEELRAAADAVMPKGRPGRGGAAPDKGPPDGKEDAPKTAPEPKPKTPPEGEKGGS